MRRRRPRTGRTPPSRSPCDDAFERLAEEAQVLRVEHGEEDRLGRSRHDERWPQDVDQLSSLPFALRLTLGAVRLSRAVPAVSRRLRPCATRRSAARRARRPRATTLQRGAGAAPDLALVPTGLEAGAARPRGPARRASDAPSAVAGRAAGAAARQVHAHARAVLAEHHLARGSRPAWPRWSRSSTRLIASPSL